MKLINILDFCLFGVYYIVSLVGLMNIGSAKLIVSTIISLYFILRVLISIINRRLNTRANNLVLSIFLIYCFFSAFWANDSLNSLEKVIMNLIFPIVIASFIAYKYDFKHILKYIFTLNSIIIIVSIVLILLAPNIGISPVYGDIQGVFIHKNSFGFQLLTNFIIGISIYKYQTRKSLYILMMIISFVLLYFSESTSNFLLTFAVIFIYLFIRIINRIKNLYMKLVLIFLNATFGIMTIYLIYMNLNSLFSAIGKDLTFTGRTSIWNAVFHNMDTKWLLGYGFDSFWIQGSIQKQYVDLVMRANVPHSHNLYVDVIATLGITGLILFCLVLVVAIIKSIKKLLFSVDSISIFSFIFLLILAMHEFNESYLIRPGTISNVLMIFIMILVVQNKKDITHENTKIYNQHIL
jgi:exopolysaccharide production protein ExoQ